MNTLQKSMGKAGKNFIRNKDIFFLTLPGIVFFFIFSYLPMAGVIIAFKDFKYDKGLFDSPWVGFTNFKFLFSNQDAFVITRNTVLMNLAFIFFGMAVSIAFALMLFEMSRKAVKTYQTIMLFPYFLSWVVISYIFIGIFDMDSGWFNGILKALGSEQILWYNEPKYWPAILIITSIWKNAGYSTIIYYTGLLGIDPGYYDAAEIDGATKLQQMRLISLPLLAPLISIILILNLGKIFNADFGMFYQLTMDSPALYPTTDVIDTYVYRALRRMNDIGMSSAAGLYQSAVGLVLVIISNSIVKKINPDNSIF